MTNLIFRPPVIFAHGFGVNWQFYEAFFPLKNLFEKNGMKFHIARTPFMQDVSTRAQVLEEEVKRIAPNGPYHLIGHSMGGIDCRHFLSHSSQASRCLSLTSIAAPNRGGPVDSDLEALVGQIHDLTEGLPALTVFQPVKEIITNSLKAMREFHPDHMNNKFNPQNLDHRDVRYFSLNFFIPQPFEQHSVVNWLKIPFDYYHRKHGHDNDGLVTVQSSMWGESLGIFEGDHYAQTGPVPFKGRLQFLQNFQTIIDNLISAFPERKVG